MAIHQSNSIGYSKRYPAELIKLASCFKGSINFVFLRYWDLAVSGFQIYGTTSFVLCHLVYQFLDLG